ncbi:MAG: NAD(P)/FAD-dependent oxidoreductase, partial [Nitrospirae bacterium]|nr:NAD(P)/FAD-dependent oxidoreductase [Nitrospirota bacterium]
IIIGSGVAGITAAANIRKIDRNGSITVITDEAYPFYSRIRLIDFLAGGADEKTLMLKKDEWYIKNRIKLILNSQAADIDNQKKEVLTASGGRLKYDRLLIATGGSSFLPPVPGSDKKGVFTLRTLKDAVSIKDYAKNAKHTLLIGGGVLGLEAGNALRKTGNSITVVESSSRLLPRQLDSEGAEIFRAQMEKMGFTFYLGAKSKEILGENKAEVLMLEDGRRIECGMIIISAGIRPNAALAQKLGLKIEKGLIVNDRLQTESSDIYAAGDLIQHRGVFYGIWPAAEKQGETAGINMAGGDAVYTGTVMSNTLKIAGIDLVSAGDIDADCQCESVTAKDSKNFIYKKLVLKDNRIIGAILYGDVRDRAKILKAITDKADISGIRTALMQWDLAALEN